MRLAKKNVDKKPPTKGYIVRRKGREFELGEVMS
jgi:hypothetical protein